jgi:predicted nucleic acid-binding Zn ribbon protein
MTSVCRTAGCERTDISARGLCSPCYQRAKYHEKLDAVAPDPGQTCARCSKPIPAERRWGAKYCSTTCKNAAIDARKRENAEAYNESRRRARGEIDGRPCLGCGEALPRSARLDAKYCSVKCGDSFRNRLRQEAKEAAKRTCPGCGGPLPKKRRTFCSEECRTDARRGHAYGLTVEALAALFTSQDGRCAICGTDEWGPKGSQVDHCHDTGAVRGVLCTNCNNGLGRFRDDPALLRAAADYLERHAMT